MEEIEKWKYCEEKVCYWCNRNLEKYYKNQDEEVGHCPFCNRSAIEVQ